MSSIVQLQYNKGDIVSKICEWSFGTNWPIVYIFYNKTNAYVGETLDAVRRTEQHMQEASFDEYTDICLISNKTFNKSVILDLESFLIKYMSAEGSRKLANGNAGVLDHAYFYKEAYEDDFREIWQALVSRGIVQKSLNDIENSELFKYSPYKSLNSEQQKATYDILHRICEMNNASAQSLVEVIGGAGTGKTILAVYLVKLLTDINHNKEVWKAIDDAEQAESIKRLSAKISSVNKIGFVVPMRKLRETMKFIFKSVDGLSKDMVLAPEEVVKDYYDLLVVDEAHRLYQRKSLPGAAIFDKFDKINRELMAEKFTKSEKDYTELDWIIRSSRMQVLFYDNRQSIRKPDIDKKRFEEICKPHLFRYYELFSQMRCKGGNGYYEYVKEVLETTNFPVNKIRHIDNYEIGVADSSEKLFEIIKEDNEQSGLSRVVCGPGWKIEENIKIGEFKYKWVGEKDDADKLYSIHKIQGFDLNYSGVIFGKEVYYDKEKRRIEVDKSQIGDPFVKDQDYETMREYVLNIYLTLMTRGIKGTFVYAVDNNLREYLKLFFGEYC